MFITCYSFGQATQQSRITDSLTRQAKQDTTRKATGKPGVVIKSKDSTLVAKTDTFSLPLSADSLDGPVTYEASDSGVLDIPGSKFFLYGKAHTTYKTLDLKAGRIEIDNGQSIAKAYFSRDTSGKVIDRPVLVDGEMTSESDSMFYNFKTQKGLTKSTYTKQEEMFVYAERIKKIDATSFYASNGRFTTCNLDTPHFAFRARRMKLVNNKWAYSGLAYPEFEGVPIPVGIPFGIYPLSRGRHSGLLAPQLTATESYGLGLEGLGYYKVLNDNFDATVRTNIYSYGGYTINFSPTYRVRYKYSGGLNLNFMNTRINFKGDPDFQTSKTFNVAWSHNMDSKARPGTTFSSNLRFGSIKYNRYVANNTNINFQNQIASSIQYSKTWGNGMYNMSVAGTHSQNDQTGLYNVSLPNLNMTVNTFYPLQKKESAGAAKWYEKLGIGYNGQVMNQFSFYDSDSPYIKYNIGEIIDTMQWGAQHQIPISVALPALGPITVSPSVSFSERWYGQQILRSWNDTLNKVDTTITKGLYASREVSFGLGMQTAIFGKFNFGKKDNIKQIRHVIRPQLSANYKPNLAKKDYYFTQIDTVGRKEQFSLYQGSLFNSYSYGSFGGMSFGLQNNLEMKVKDKEDTAAGATKKIRLLDNLSINSSYNFMADSLKLAPFSILASTTLFDKINITASTVLDPYLTDSIGRPINKYAWEGDKFSLGRFSNGSLSIGASFQSKRKEDNKGGDEEDDGLDKNSFITPEDQMRAQEYIRNNPAEFADFNVPWTLNISYSLSFSQQRKPDYSGYTTRTYSSLNLQGDFNLTPKWKAGSTVYYDLSTFKVQTLTMFLSRELHCWQLAINIVPVGLYRSFNISISPKSALLRDLKVNRTRTFTD
ncbi:MAG TPA: putative LPS assembly protein LptD [Phnomibacter sp.]|nr:putative LPS assembly protein LptD [Phnomibacter sp.]